MKQRKGFLAIAAMVGVAMATGHVMQFGLPFAGRAGHPEPETASLRIAIEHPVAPRPRPLMPVLAGGSGTLTGALPRLPDAAFAEFALIAEPLARRPVPADVIRVPDNTVYNDLNAFGIACETALSLVPLEDAQVGLKLEANCNPNERILISHAGLSFAAQTTALGTYEATVPAFRSPARFRVEFGDGSAREAHVALPGAGDFDRVALLWSGAENLSIHAFEFGADRGDPGHVHRTQPGPVARLSGAVGGKLQRLGDPALDRPAIAEVYSFPSGHSARAGVVRLVVEAEVTAFNCGKTIDAAAIQTEPEGGVRTVALALEMPDCEAVGDILVLKNVLRDLRIASN